MTALADTWYSLSLGDGMAAPMLAVQIEEAFLPVFESAGRPVGMAVFGRSEEGGLHCELVAYFSPAAAKVAQAFDAEPCAKPVRVGLTLLAGDAQCWSTLLPDTPA